MVIDIHFTDGLSPTACKKVFTCGAVYNIDYNPSAGTSHDSIHGTAISLIQFPTPDIPGRGTQLLLKEHRHHCPELHISFSCCCKNWSRRSHILWFSESWPKQDQCCHEKSEGVAGTACYSGQQRDPRWCWLLKLSRWKVSRPIMLQHQQDIFNNSLASKELLQKKLIP